ncbi:MAG TPA: CbiX/SirB N-terminal domain-containing protein [Casimicrobiaceae bacterium]|nr:CbiX/SirB N-terminal domain-containing protein [Casimicrobiaceae bacterium]
MTERGLILFAHGSREPRWAEPFEAIAQRVRDALPGVAVRLAFLERMEPDLASALGAFAAEGVKRATVVPLFLGQGGHLRDDLPRLVRAIAEEQRALDITLAPVAGESPIVLDALAAYCVQALRG